MRERIQKLADNGILALLTVLLVAVYGLSGLSHAQDVPGGSGLQISPTRTELNINPGEVKEFSVTVRNVTSGDITVATFLNDFTPGDNGEPKLIVDPSKPPEPSSLKNYLLGLQDFDLKSGESKEVKYVIDIPVEAGAGALYGAVRYVAIPKGADRSTAERQVALNASVASLILVQVEGDIIESIQIEKMEVRKDEKAGSFFTSPPNKAAIAIQNKGNSYSKPFGNVQLLGMNGSEVHSYEFNSKDPRGNVLPQSSRSFVDDISGIKMPGRYTLVANISHGSGGEVITQKVSFWYMPWWVIALIVLLIAAIGFVVYRFVIRRGRTRKVKKF
jgi:hypothetical protein